MNEDDIAAFCDNLKLSLIAGLRNHQAILLHTKDDIDENGIWWGCTRAFFFGRYAAQQQLKTEAAREALLRRLAEKVGGA